MFLSQIKKLFFWRPSTSGSDGLPRNFIAAIRQRFPFVLLFDQHMPAVRGVLWHRVPAPILVRRLVRNTEDALPVKKSPAQTRKAK